MDFKIPSTTIITVYKVFGRKKNNSNFENQELYCKCTKITKPLQWLAPAKRKFSLSLLLHLSLRTTKKNQFTTLTLDVNYIVTKTCLKVVKMEHM